MARNLPKSPADYIVPLEINGLEGRMLYIPAPKKYTDRELLFIYGHHSSLERWWGLVQVINRYGAVTMPDLPGFGGMDSYYKVGKKPTIDNLADYLAAFIKLRYKNKKFVVVGMSFGFVILTRMLQRYPELTKKVEICVSIAGFAHRDDFVFSKPRWLFYRWAAAFFTLAPNAFVFRHVFLSRPVLSNIYKHTHNAKHKFRGIVGEELDEITKFEIRLWHDNDVRTYMKTTTQFLTLDNCLQPIDLPVYHVAVKADRYFDSRKVKQHLETVFSKYNLLAELKAGNHAPTVIADAKAAGPYIPIKLRRLLARKVQ